MSEEEFLKLIDPYTAPPKNGDHAEHCEKAMFFIRSLWVEETQKQARAIEMLKAALERFASKFNPKFHSYDSEEMKEFVDANQVTPGGNVVGDFRNAYDTLKQVRELLGEK